MRLKTYSVLPGFGTTMGLGLGYFTILVLFPIAVLTWYSLGLGMERFVATVLDREVLLALRFTLVCSLAGALTNLVLGLVLAYALETYHFAGRRFLDACVDLPFALPTAVAGIAISYLISENGWVGQVLGWFGISMRGADYVAVTLALIFVGIPFVVRTVQPVIRTLDRSESEAALTLGARPRQIFFRIILPAILPAAFTGFSLALARAIGEYGSVIFVASNLPYKSQILPVVIVGKIESHNYEKAAAIGVFMLFISLVLLLLITLLKKWSERRGR